MTNTNYKINYLYGTDKENMRLITSDYQLFKDFLANELYKNVKELNNLEYLKKQSYDGLRCLAINYLNAYTSQQLVKL